MGAFFLKNNLIMMLLPRYNYLYLTTQTNNDMITKNDLTILIITISFFILSIGGLSIGKKITHGNGTIETEKLIQQRIK